MQVKINADRSSIEPSIISQSSWQMRIFTFIIILCACFGIYIAINFKIYYVAIQSLLFVFIYFYISSFRISFNSDFIRVDSLLIQEKRVYEEITSIEIMPLYGRFFIPGVPGFVIAVGHQRYSRILNVRFAGCAYPHDLTKLFINAALEKNPAITVSKSLIHSYGAPPYTVNPDVLAKLKSRAARFEPRSR